MIRIDKWLWYARVVKSRSLAQKLVKGGNVRVNKNKVTSPSASLKPDDVLTMVLERRVLVYRVIAEGTRRGPYEEARLLYEDLSPPPTPEKKPNIMKGIGPQERPDKRDRKKLRQLKESGNNGSQ